MSIEPSLRLPSTLRSFVRLRHRSQLRTSVVGFSESICKTFVSAKAMSSKTCQITICDSQVV